MTTIKSYTDLEQSKKLAEILPLESADMSYSFNFNSETYELSTVPYKNWIVPKYAQPDDGFGQVIPCWSLAALLDILPSGYEIVKNYHSLYFVESRDHGKSTNIFNNPVDACYEMILKLNELKML